MNMQLLERELQSDEGIRLKPYVDTRGKTSIGIGRNLTDDGISEDEAMIMLGNDINGVCDDLDRTMPWWREMTDNRQRVLANMCFNMGLGTLQTFYNTLAAMRAGQYDQAANGMLASHWATQVGQRAQRLATMMREG